MLAAITYRRLVGHRDGQLVYSAPRFETAPHHTLKAPGIPQRSGIHVHLSQTIASTHLNGRVADTGGVAISAYIHLDVLIVVTERNNGLRDSKGRPA